MTLPHDTAGALGVPLALAGESANAGNTALAIISIVSMFVGYVLLACLWHFVFRDRARARRRKNSSD